MGIVILVCVLIFTFTDCLCTEDQSHVDGEKTSSSDDIQIVEDVQPKPRIRSLAFLKRKYQRKDTWSTDTVLCMFCGLARLGKRLKETPTDPIQKKIFFSCLVMDKIPAAEAVRLFEEKYSGDGRVCAYHYAQANEDLSADDIIKFYKYCRSLFYPSTNSDSEVPEASPPESPASVSEDEEEVEEVEEVEEARRMTNHYFWMNSSSKMACEEERIPLKIVKDDDAVEVAVDSSSKGSIKGTRKRRIAADDNCAEAKPESDERLPDEDNHSSSSVEQIDEHSGEQSPDDSKLRRRSSKDGVRRAMMKANPNKKFKDLVKELFANPPAPRKRERSSQKSSETLENYIRKEDQLCNRLEICSSLYLRNRRREFLDRIIVYEEKWIVYDYTYRNVGRLSKKSDPQEKAEPSDISTKRRSMLTVWWSSYGVILHKVLSSSPSKEGRTFTSYIREMNKCLLEQQPWLVQGPAPIFFYDSSCGYIRRIGGASNSLEKLY
ncbi:hypothetical protein OSTOST_08745 [Ostertagia ostertagi]